MSSGGGGRMGERGPAEAEVDEDDMELDSEEEGRPDGSNR